MIRVHYKREYLKAFDALNHEEQRLAITADEEIRSHHEGAGAVFGLRVKKLYANKGAQVFEARVSRSLRVLWVKEGHEIFFTMIGSHDEVKKYLKNL